MERKRTINSQKVPYKTPGRNSRTLRSSPASKGGCRGHQKGNTSLTRGNALAKKAAKMATQQQLVLQAVAVALRPDSPPFPMVPSYTPEELEWAKRGGPERDLSGRLTKDNKLLIPGAKQWKVIKHFHESFHLGQDSPYSNWLLRCSWVRDCPKLLKISPGLASFVPAMLQEATPYLHP